MLSLNGKKFAIVLGVWYATLKSTLMESCLQPDVVFMIPVNVFLTLYTIIHTNVYDYTSICIRLYIMYIRIQNMYNSESKLYTFFYLYNLIHKKYTIIQNYTDFRKFNFFSPKLYIDVYGYKCICIRL